MLLGWPIPHSRPTNYLPPTSPKRPCEEGTVGKARLAGKSSCPFALCLSIFVFLPETQTWCLEAQEPSCDMRTKDTQRDTETEAWTVVLRALTEHAAGATGCFPLDFLNWRKSSPPMQPFIVLNDTQLKQS